MAMFSPNPGGPLEPPRTPKNVRRRPLEEILRTPKKKGAASVARHRVSYQRSPRKYGGCLGSRRSSTESPSISYGPTAEDNIFGNASGETSRRLKSASRRPMNSRYFWSSPSPRYGATGRDSFLANETVQTPRRSRAASKLPSPKIVRKRPLEENSSKPKKKGAASVAELRARYRRSPLRYGRGRGSRKSSTSPPIPSYGATDEGSILASESVETPRRSRLASRHPSVCRTRSTLSHRTGRVRLGRSTPRRRSRTGRRFRRSSSPPTPPYGATDEDIFLANESVETPRRPRAASRHSSTSRYRTGRVRLGTSTPRRRPRSGRRSRPRIRTRVQRWVRSHVGSLPVRRIRVATRSEVYNATRNLLDLVKRLDRITRRFQREATPEEGALLTLEHSLQSFFERFGILLGPRPPMTVAEMREEMKKTIERVQTRISDEAGYQLRRLLIHIQQGLEESKECFLNAYFLCIVNDYLLFLGLSNLYSSLF